GELGTTAALSATDGGDAIHEVAGTQALLHQVVGDCDVHGSPSTAAEQHQHRLLLLAPECVGDLADFITALAAGVAQRHRHVAYLDGTAAAGATTLLQRLGQPSLELVLLLEQLL